MGKSNTIHITKHFFRFIPRSYNCIHFGIIFSFFCQGRRIQHEKYVPSDGEDGALFHILHDDGDAEDLDETECSKAIEEHRRILIGCCGICYQATMDYRERSRETMEYCEVVVRSWKTAR